MINLNQKMSREIKFRIWDNKYKVMRMEDFVIDNSFDCVSGWLDNSILMQYTGLKDKNGKEIYEYDFVKCIAAPSGKKVAGEMIGKIMQDHFGWTISVWFKNEWWGYAKMDFRSLEVIGNVYENPELVTRAVGQSF